MHGDLDQKKTLFLFLSYFKCSVLDHLPGLIQLYDLLRGKIGLQRGPSLVAITEE